MTSVAATSVVSTAFLKYKIPSALLKQSDDFNNLKNNDDDNHRLVEQCQFGVATWRVGAGRE